MAFAHPLDPPIQTAAAARFGKLLAQGVVAHEDAVRALLDAALKAGYAGDQSGLQARLSWHVMDAALHWESTRDRAAAEIKRGIAGLLSEWAEPQAILAAAEQINRERGEPFLWREIKELVAGEMAWRLRTRGKRRRVG
jgi:hypothetical protein